MRIYLTNHAYRRLCERLQTIHTKEEILEILNERMNEGVSTGEHIYIGGHAIGLKLAHCEDQVVCATIYRTFIPVFSHRKPVVRRVALSWKDSKELKGYDTEPDVVSIQEFENAIESAQA